MTDEKQEFAQCPQCRGLVAEDQRYCLSCGARQPNARLPESMTGSAPGGGAKGPELSGAQQPRDWTPVVAVGGLAAMALVLVIGVLIGKSGEGATKAAANPQVVTVAGTGAAANTGTTAATGGGSSGASINEDWPAGKDAWTVQLQTVAKAGATGSSVSSAKSAATGKGAPGVGVLDAANYNGLGSDYIIYSGVYDSQAKATAALGKVKSSFPSAKVIHVSPSGGAAASGGAGQGAAIPAAQQQQGAAAIQTIQNACSGGNTAQCSKASKVTKPIATPGAPPPVDNKAPGGGSGGGQTFQ